MDQLIGWKMCSALQGRAPVLLDNLAQAILMAPFFVIFEVSRHYDLIQTSYVDTHV